MKRVLTLLITCLLALVLALATPGVAEAKKKKKRVRDTPGCVSRVEYRAIRGGMTPAKVASIFDTAGSGRFYNDHGYFQGSYENTGYWSEEWVDESYLDEFGNVVEDGHYASVWVPDETWNEYAEWVPMIDTVRLGWLGRVRGGVMRALHRVHDVWVELVLDGGTGGAERATDP